MVVPISTFLGVPHTPLNSYIRTLCTYQRRTGRGHRVTIPDIPDFVLEPQAPTQASRDGQNRHVDGGNGRSGRVAQPIPAIAELTEAIDGMLDSKPKTEKKGKATGKQGSDGGLAGLVMGKRGSSKESNASTHQQEESEWSWDSDVSSVYSPEDKDGTPEEYECPDFPSRVKPFTAKETSVDVQKETEKKAQTLEPQRSALHARAYAACMFEPIVGNTVQKTVAGDAKSVKTYGWSMVSSEQVGNAPMTIAFDASAKGVKKHVSLVYLGGLEKEFDMLLKTLVKVGYLKGVRGWTSRNAHEALALSEWICHNPNPAPGKDHDGDAETRTAHNSLECTCKEKTKRVLVCAVREGDCKILPLRYETYVWRPKSAEQITAYARFARDLIVSQMGI